MRSISRESSSSFPFCKSCKHFSPRFARSVGCIGGIENMFNLTPMERITTVESRNRLAMRRAIGAYHKFHSWSGLFIFTCSTSSWNRSRFSSYSVQIGKKTDNSSFAERVIFQGIHYWERNGKWRKKFDKQCSWMVWPKFWSTEQTYKYRITDRLIWY